MGPVLVLGAGQVGTFSARALHETGVPVVVGDVQPALGYFSRFGPRGSVDLVAVDILDADHIRMVLDRYGVDRIVLAAGLVGAACSNYPEHAWAVNVEGPRRVCEAALDRNLARLVFLSSLAVYGPSRKELVSEDEPIAPRSEYGRTKAAAEEVLQGFLERGLDIVVLRPCGVYGPLRFGGGSQSAQLIEAVLLAAFHQQQLAIAAAPGVADEYIYVKDLASAVSRITSLTGRPAQHVLNVGAGIKTSPDDILRVLRRLVPSLDAKVERTGQIVAEWTPQLNGNRIRQICGFEPAFDFEHGMADYVEELGLQKQ
jgi:nucleoside-diphosphate-sugar epimerase